MVCVDWPTWIRFCHPTLDASVRVLAFSQSGAALWRTLGSVFFVIVFFVVREHSRGQCGSGISHERNKNERRCVIVGSSVAAAAAAAAAISYCSVSS